MNVISKIVLKYSQYKMQYHTIPQQTYTQADIHMQIHSHTPSRLHPHTHTRMYTRMYADAHIIL